MTPGQDRKERAEQAEKDRGPSGPITRKPPTRSIGMCPSGSPLWGGVVVERRRHPRHPDPPGGPTEARVPGSETHHWGLPDDQPGSTQHRSQTLPCGNTVGQPPASLRPPTRQPPEGGPRHENSSERIAHSETGCSLFLDAGIERKKLSSWR